jgi:hypothetical protein
MLDSTYVIQRNYTARELRMKKEKEKVRDAKNKMVAKNTKNAPESSSRPPKSNLTQQSAGVPQSRSSELHVAVSTMSTTPAVAAAPAAIPSMTSLPDAIIPRAGCWTRFWLFLLCASSTQYTYGHH